MIAGYFGKDGVVDEIKNAEARLPLKKSPFEQLKSQGLFKKVN